MKIELFRNFLFTIDQPEDILQRLFSLSLCPYENIQQVLELAHQKIMIFREVGQFWHEFQETASFCGLEEYTGNLDINGQEVHGLPKHADPYDIVVVQLWGEKKWTFFKYSRFTEKSK